MKILIISLLMSALCGIARAESQCFEFNVTRYATEITKLRIELVDKSAKAPFKAKLTGTTSDKKISTPFECSTEKSVEIACTQKEGGGDFKLKIDTFPSMTFSYMNLAIGADAPHTAKRGVELDEEFAILNTVPSDDDEEEEAGEIGDISIKGSNISCETKH